MKVFFAPAAKLDLLSIGEHIGQENPDRAVSFVDEHIDHCYTLAELPRRYPLVPRYEDHGIRRCVHGNYLIFYRVHAELDIVQVIHILHGARDYASLLFPDA